MAESASSVLSGADAQIGSADYLSVKLPLSGLAEGPTFISVRLTVCSGVSEGFRASLV